ncbi:hypothetical protein GALL_244990 [mine drainage metagenome]|uniref:Uncharacterized protein n=1 Tax=mine drainage metagenome TaxID=410659 RepID=A0A1J5RVN3_9ZZZZ
MLTRCVQRVYTVAAHACNRRAAPRRDDCAKLSRSSPGATRKARAACATCDATQLPPKTALNGRLAAPPFGRATSGKSKEGAAPPPAAGRVGIHPAARCGCRLALPTSSSGAPGHEDAPSVSACRLGTFSPSPPARDSRHARRKRRASRDRRTHPSRPVRCASRASGPGAGAARASPPPWSAPLALVAAAPAASVRIPRRLPRPSCPRQSASARPGGAHPPRQPLRVCHVGCFPRSLLGAPSWHEGGLGKTGTMKLSPLPWPQVQAK